MDDEVMRDEGMLLLMAPDTTLLEAATPVRKFDEERATSIEGL